jgi:hypothetical protein
MSARGSTSRARQYFGVAAATLMTLLLSGCISFRFAKPFSLDVPAEGLRTIPAPESLLTSLPDPQPSEASAEVDARAAFTAAKAHPERTDMRGAGDGSMKVERVVVTGGKDIPHRAPDFSPEQTASMICMAQKVGFNVENALRAHQATLASDAARRALDAGTISLKDADKAELKRQAALQTALMPLPIISLFANPIERKKDLPPPRLGDLTLEDVDLFTFKENGKEVMAVSGVVRNSGRTSAELPPLTLEAIDQWGFVLAGETSLLPVAHLPAGEAQPFEVRFRNPPANTQEVVAHFAPPFSYRSPRDCDFFDPASFNPTDAFDRRETQEDETIIDRLKDGSLRTYRLASTDGVTGDYQAGELNLLTRYFQRESARAWRCRDALEPGCAGAEQRLHWRDMFEIADASDEAWMALRASEETRARQTSSAEISAADEARAAAMKRLHDMGDAALARAGGSAPDVSVDLTASTFSRDKTGMHIDIAGRVTNTGAETRTVTALMLALVDRLELPLSSVALPVDLRLAAGASMDFIRRIPVMQRRGDNMGAPAAAAGGPSEPAAVYLGRVPPDDIAWQIRVGAMGR